MNDNNIPKIHKNTGNAHRKNSVKEEDKQTSFIQIKCSRKFKAKLVKAANKKKLGTWIKEKMDTIADEELAKRNIVFDD